MDITNEELKTIWLSKVQIHSPVELILDKYLNLVPYIRNNKNNKEIQFKYNTCLYEVPKTLCDDYDINLTAAIYGKELFNNLSKELKKSKEFILQLIENKYIHSIDIGSSSILDESLVEQLIARKQRHIFFPSSLLQNRQFIVRNFPHYNFYEGFCEREVKSLYRNDLEILKLYILHHNTHYYSTLSERYKKLFQEISKDNLFMNSLISRNIDNEQSSDSIHTLLRFYEKLPIDYKSDLKLIDCLLTKNTDVIKLLPSTILNDKKTMLSLLKKHNVSIQYCSTSIQKDTEIIYSYLKHDIDNFKKLSYQDLSLARYLLSKKPDISLLNTEMLKNKKLVLEFLHADEKNCKRICFLGGIYQNDYDVVKLCIQLNHYDLFKQSLLSQKDEKLVSLFLEKSQDINHITPHLFSKKQLILSLLKNPDNIYKIIENPLFYQYYHHDKDIINILIEYDGSYIQYSSLYKADKSMVLKAIEYGLQNAEFIDKSFYTDIALMTTFIEMDGANIVYLPYALMSKDIVKIALKRIDLYDSVIKRTSLTTDVDFHLQLIEQNYLIYNRIHHDFILKSDESILKKYIEMCPEELLMIPKNVLNFYDIQNPQQMKSKLHSLHLDKQLNDKTISAINNNTHPKIKI